MSGGGAVAIVWKSVVALIVCLVVIDVIGVLACVYFEIKPFGGYSQALPYAIWFVGGVFAATFTLILTGNWVSGGESWLDGVEAPRIATGVLLTCAPILAALSLLFWRLYWSRHVAGEYFVPDSMPHTLTYFLSALVIFATAPFLLKPKPKPAV